jgi:hypothetical protein
MKKLFSICFLFFSSFVFSQDKDYKETTITAENLKKTVLVKDLIPEFQSNIEVFSSEYTFKKKGQMCQEAANGKEIPKSIIDYPFKKGDFIFLDLKAKVLDNTKDSKIITISQKLIIE